MTIKAATPPVPGIAIANTVMTMTKVEYTIIMKAGAKKKAMPTATNRPTVKMIKAKDRRFEACGFVNPPPFSIT